MTSDDDTLTIPWFLRRDDEFKVKLEHQLAIISEEPCSCCKPEKDFENYRNIFEEDFRQYHRGYRSFLNLLRRDGEGYYHMEANRAWEYFKKGILVGCKI